MRIYDRFILTLASVFAVTAALLATSEKQLDFYFSVYLIEFLVLAIVFGQVNREARTTFDRLAILGAPIFGAIVLYRAVSLLLSVGIAR